VTGKKKKNFFSHDLSYGLPKEAGVNYHTLTAVHNFKILNNFYDELYIYI
jgi:hypothetical protein